MQCGASRALDPGATTTTIRIIELSAKSIANLLPGSRAAMQQAAGVFKYWRHH
jgi:hypothetical protein